ncbi:PcfJ domain-containing protein [Flavobacterium johnsoniae]|uniref:PcfJ domain-containing protein n=1 Tax=Flavobacterium TaxID=237 RepID=UPI0023E3C2BE|nr:MULTISPECIES: PcfJ domain-containing protein [Flavobacterium]WET04034.1 PcfJ domain-containing protein [Flavobacterium sp. YJ01]WJS94521.1 PcfJ domain-containing protein [Flavobacterium johnsoniae]
MTPKTIIEKQLTALSASLAPIREEVFTWAEQTIFLKWGVLSRSRFYCLDCAHVWKPSCPSTCAKFTSCPACAGRLKMMPYNQVHFKETEYFAVIERCAGFQVVRMDISHKHMKKNFAPSYFHKEVMQHWINPKGDVRTLARSTNVFSSNLDAWKFYSPLEIKPKDFIRNSRFYINPFKVYPQMKVLPILKRNGFKTSVYDIAPHLLFSSLLSDPVAETLLKSRQLNLLQYYLCASRQNIRRNWQAVKTVIRNHYKISDVPVWEDYLELLRYFKKDLSCPLYVCPENLCEAHDHFVKKKRDLLRKKKLRDLRLEIEKAQKRYANDKKRFFGLSFRDGQLSISVIEEVKDFMAEGDDLGHCVFTNEYYVRKDSLILSAKFCDKSMETIEISLSRMEILQCRGLKNKPSRHHRQILQLLSQNLYQIKERMKKRKPKIISR